MPFFLNFFAIPNHPSLILFIFHSVYRFYTSVLFHGSLLHVLFNMLALVPLGTELERIMGSVRLLFLMFLLATTNAILHLAIAFLVAYNPLYPFPYLVNECSIGFSGVIFSMIVIETSLSGVQSRRCVDFLVTNT
jgi:membrane associated rhomboid family serine protease